MQYEQSEYSEYQLVIEYLCNLENRIIILEQEKEYETENDS